MTNAQTIPAVAGTPAPGMPDGSVRRGIATIANDKVMHWLLPLLESHRETNGALPLYVIPYNDQCERTRRVTEAYGATFVEADSAALDRLSKKLFPLSLGKRFRLRKFLSLALPLDEVCYVDADIVLYRDLAPLFGRLRPAGPQFIVASRTVDYVYNRSYREVDYLRDAFLFSDGFFITSPSILSIDDFYEAMREDEAVFDRVRQRGGLYAQPLCNFVVHRKGLKVAAVEEIEPDFSCESYHKAEGVTFDADGRPLDERGLAIVFAHWAGVAEPSGREVFDDGWKALGAKAEARMRAAGA